MPALNEEATIGAVIEEVRATLPGCDILVIDDGSTDSTAAVAFAAGARVASLPFNLGVGGAMRLGFRIASAEGYANVVQLDSDGQHDPANLEALIAGLAEADIVIGARFAGAGEYRVTGPRWWAMRVLARILSRTTKTTLTDTTSGFKANGPRAVEVFAREYPAEYLGDTIEALVLAARSGLVITQLPVAMRPRQGGTPSQSPLKATRHLVRAFIALGFALLRPREARNA
jgi:glycosyltransferase involved in cell wall biosynthesis